MAETRRRRASLPVKRVTRVNLPDEIYAQIKDLILDGGIAPGQQVTIQGLAEDFGVSAMPVREALQRLTAERALTVVAGRSVGIPLLSAGRLQDLRRVRLEIESLAGRWCAERIAKPAFAALEAHVSEMDRAIARQDSHAFVLANREFHFAVYRAADSETLLSIIEGLWLQVSPYFHLLHESGNYVAANEQHKKLVLALKRRDGDSASEAISADINAAAEVLMDLLEGDMEIV